MTLESHPVGTKSTHISKFSRFPKLNQSTRQIRSNWSLKLGGCLTRLTVIRLGILRRRLIQLASSLLGLGEVENAEQLLGEHEVLGPEDLVGTRVIEVCKDNLGVDQELSIEKGLGVDTSSFGLQIGQGHLVNKLISGASDSVEIGTRDLGEDDLLGKTPRFTDQYSARLGQPLDDQRSGHDGKAGEVIVKMLLRERQILDRPRELPTAELDQFVDPNPTHRRGNSPQGTIEKERPASRCELQEPSVVDRLKARSKARAGRPRNKARRIF